MARTRQPKTIEEQITSVEREIAMRKAVYSKRVLDGRMKPEQAAHEYDCMLAVLDTLYAARTGRA